MRWKKQPINDKCIAPYRQSIIYENVEAVSAQLQTLTAHPDACRHEKVANAASLSRPHLPSIAQQARSVSSIRLTSEVPGRPEQEDAFHNYSQICFPFPVSMATAQKHRNRRMEWEVWPTLRSVCWPRRAVWERSSNSWWELNSLIGCWGLRASCSCLFIFHPRLTNWCLTQWRSTGSVWG